MGAVVVAGTLLAAAAGADCGGRLGATTPAPRAWCNRAVPADAAILRLPPVEDVRGTPVALDVDGGPDWLVVWATWCEPCRAEWPRIERVLGLLRQRGVEVRVTLLSIDTSAAAVADDVRARRPGEVAGVRVVRSRSADAFEDWARRYGFASSQSGLPFHLLASAEGKLTCVHAGALFDSEVDALADRLARP